MERHREDRVRSSPGSLDEASSDSVALVLAAHGAGEGSAVNEGLKRRVERLGAPRPWGAFTEVAVAFHDGTPGFAEVLSSVRSRTVVVVPFFMSAGYYSGVVLPRGLEQDPAFREKAVTVTTAVGLHPALPPIVRERIDGLVAENRLQSPAVAIVGHGTKRHAQSRRSALDLARWLSERRQGTVEAFFLDDDPPISEIVAFAADSPLVVIPFLVGSGPHLEEDVRGAAEAGGQRRRGDTLIDRPVGEDPAIDELVLDLAASAAPTS